MTFPAAWLVICACLATQCRAAAFGDDFANNLFTDLAPILALFGERVTLQYLSQSTGWADNFILSMAPLGIITIIVSAIRVGGPTWLKAVIGRARENVAAAEAELMCSTSPEVCELWNGSNIVRCTGAAPIREFICLFPESQKTKDEASEDEVNRDHEASRKDEGDITISDTNHQPHPGQAGKYLDNLPLQLQRGLVERATVDKSTRYRLKQRLEVDTTNWLRFTKGFARGQERHLVVTSNRDKKEPNISMNLHRESHKELRATAAIATVIQLGSLAYAALATYKLQYPKDGNDSVSAYAFPCTAAGTIALICGLLLCCFVVEASTVKSTYETAKGYVCRPIWIQKEATVGDQEFFSFAISPENAGHSIFTSRRRDAGMGVTNVWVRRLNYRLAQVAVESWHRLSRFISIPAPDILWPEEFHRAHDRLFMIGVTVTGACVGVLGFVVQFIGLRGMHWSVSVVQLGAVLLMAALRALVRRNFSRSPRVYELIPGFELDWLAHCLTYTRDYEVFGLPSDKLSEKHIFDRPVTNPCTNRWEVATGTTCTAYEKLVVIEYLSKKDKESIGDFNEGPGATAFESQSTSASSATSSHPQVTSPPANMTANHAAIVTKKNSSVKKAELHTIMRMRTELGRLSEWRSPVRQEALAVTKAVEIVLETLFTDPSADQFMWTLKVYNAYPFSEAVTFDLSRIDGKWSLCSEEIEAALSLWLHSVALIDFRDPQGNDAEYGDRSLRILSPSTPRKRRDLLWWMPRDDNRLFEAIEVEKEETFGRSVLGKRVRRHRMVGQGYDGPRLSRVNHHYRTRPMLSFPRPSEVQFQPIGRLQVLVAEDENSEDSTPSRRNTPPRYIVSHPSCPQELLFAQELFSAFICSFSQNLQRPIPGRTIVQPLDAMEQNNWNAFTLRNDRLSSMINRISDTGLGTVLDIHELVIPALMVQDKLPDTDCVIALARQRAEQFESRGSFSEAGSVYIWLWNKMQMYPSDSPLVLEAAAVLLQHWAQINKAVALLREGCVHDLNQWQALWEQIYHLERVVNKHPTVKALREAYDNDHTPSLWGLPSIPQDQGWGWRFCRSHMPQLLLHMTSGRHFDYKDIHIMGHASFPFGSEHPGEADHGVSQHLLNVTAARVHSGRGFFKMANENSEPYEFPPKHVLLSGDDIFYRRPLHYFIIRGDNRKTLAELVGGADPNARDLAGHTPLHYACMTGNFEGARALTANGADVDMKSRNGTSPLHCAAYCGHFSIVQNLVETGADTRAVNYSRSTALMMAVQKGHLVIVKYLLGNSEAYIRDAHGRTPLHLAALSGIHEMIDIFSSIDVDARDKYGATPLLLAAASGSVSIVKKLIQLGAATATADHHGLTPLSHAAVFGHTEMAEILLQQSTADFQPEATNAMVQPNLESIWPPLALAAEIPSPGVVRLLLEAGTDPNQNNPIAASTLHVAAASGDKDVVRLLLRFGAELDKRSAPRHTALHVGAYVGSQDAVDVLLEAGADVHSRDKSGHTPLHLASLNGHEEVVELLIRHGSKPDSQQKSGLSALQLAAKYGHSTTVRLLFEKGASVEMLTKVGHTPFLSAIEMKQVATAKALVDFLPPDSRQFEIHYALYWSIENTCRDMEQLIRTEFDID